MDRKVKPKVEEKKEPAVYVVVDKELIKVDSPPTGFGEQHIVWQDGKPTHIKVSHTKKI